MASCRYLCLTKYHNFLPIISKELYFSHFQKWRPFCENFKTVVENYSFGTLLRADCKEDYSESNSFIVPRIQFLAIELARNKEGYNDAIRTKFKASK